MKGLITLIVSLLMVVNIYGQEPVLVPQTSDWYLQKSKKQKTTARVLLISGSAMIIGGIILYELTYERDPYSFLDIYGSNTGTDIAGIIFLAGVAADLVSIPFFIKAGINKRKAASLSFNMQNYLPYHENNITSNPVPSLTVRIKF